jgi:DNA-binding MarR family transcriptional regulator
MDRSDIVETEELFRNVLRMAKLQWQQVSDTGLSRTAIAALYLLEQKGDLKATEIAEMLQITSGAVTFIVDQLIEQGVVDRDRDVVDSRVVIMKITPAGRAFLETLMVARQQFIERLFIGLEQEDVEHIKRIFKVILVNLKQNKENSDH